MNEDYTYYTQVEDNDEELMTGFDHTGIDSGENDSSCDYDDSDLFLGFINEIGTEMDGLNQYEFVFTLYPEEFWGENFNYKPAGICNGLKPDDKYVQKVVTIKTILKLDLIQDSGCFSMQDCMDGIIALAYENLDGYDNYPEDGRLYFMFAEKYDKVENKLAIKHILL